MKVIILLVCLICILLLCHESVMFVGHSIPSVYAYCCEAGSVTGFETSIRSGPVPEATVLTVGEQPMIALYKFTKVIFNSYLITHSMPTQTAT